MAREDATGGQVDRVKEKRKERIRHGRERGILNISVHWTHMSGQLNGENWMEARRNDV